MILSNNFHAHSYIKDKLLAELDSYSIDKIKGDDGDSISKTDYFSNTEYNYKNIIRPHLCDHILKTLKTPKFELTDIWFQQYNKNDNHSWHVHEKTHFTNVYFLELKDSNLKTEVKDMQGEIIEYTAQEGDIITFPAFFLHKAPIVTTEERKTIISFNVGLVS